MGPIGSMKKTSQINSKYNLQNKSGFHGTGETDPGLSLSLENLVSIFKA